MPAAGFRQMIPELYRWWFARKEPTAVIVLGVVGYLPPVPGIFATIDWILVIGLVLLVIGQNGRPVGGRRYWY